MFLSVATCKGCYLKQLLFGNFYETISSCSVFQFLFGEVLQSRAHIPSGVSSENKDLEEHDHTFPPWILAMGTFSRPKHMDFFKHCVVCTLWANQNRMNIQLTFPGCTDGTGTFARSCSVWGAVCRRQKFQVDENSCGRDALLHFFRCWMNTVHNTVYACVYMYRFRYMFYYLYYIQWNIHKSKYVVPKFWDDYYNPGDCNPDIWTFLINLPWEPRPIMLPACWCSLVMKRHLFSPQDGELLLTVTELYRDMQGSKV